MARHSDAPYAHRAVSEASYSTFLEITPTESLLRCNQSGSSNSLAPMPAIPRALSHPWRPCVRTLPVPLLATRGQRLSIVTPRSVGTPQPSHTHKPLGRARIFKEDLPFPERLNRPGTILINAARSTSIRLERAERVILTEMRRSETARSCSDGFESFPIKSIDLRPPQGGFVV